MIQGRSNPIVYACDFRWIPYLHPLIRRIEELHSIPLRHYVIIVEQRSGEASSSLEKLKIFSNEIDADVRPIIIPESRISEYVDLKSSRLPAGTYLRVLIPEIILDEDYVIYLDIDVWIEREFSYLLWLKPVKALAAHFQFGSINAFRLFKNHDMNYFLAGTLVMNLHRLRELDFSKKVMDLLKENRNWVNLEMDAMNYLLNPIGEVEPLNANFCWLIDYPNRKKNTSSEGFLYHDPAIVHFVGSLKPWSPLSPREGFYGKSRTRLKMEFPGLLEDNFLDRRLYVFLRFVYRKILKDTKLKVIEKALLRLSR